MVDTLYTNALQNYVFQLNDEKTSELAQIDKINSDNAAAVSGINAQVADLQNSDAADKDTQLQTLSGQIDSDNQTTLQSVNTLNNQIDGINQRLDLITNSPDDYVDQIAPLVERDSQRASQQGSNVPNILITYPPDKASVTGQTDIQIRLVLTLLLILLWGAGPVTAGFTYVLRNYAREEHAWIWSDFIRVLRENFKQGMAVWLIDWVVFYVMAFAFFYYGSMPGWMAALQVLIGLLFVLYTFMHFYIYPMMVTFKLRLRDLYRNSALFAFGRLFHNIGVLLLILLFTLPFLYFSNLSAIVLIILVIFILLSFLGFIVNFSVYPQLKKFMIIERDEVKPE